MVDMHYDPNCGSFTILRRVGVRRKFPTCESAMASSTPSADIPITTLSAP